MRIKPKLKELPLYRDINEKDGTRIVIWEVSESHQFFKEALLLSHDELEFVKTLNNKRELEWMASRYLMQHVLDIDLKANLRKDKFGKPYLLQDDVHISISHSHEFSAIAMSPKIIGIDIQLELDKISRIAAKFISQEETLFIEEEKKIAYYHTIWGAKESMYKAYGRKEVRFKEDMLLESFQFTESGFTFAGRLEKEKIFHYEIKAEKFKDYHFVVAKQK